MTDQKHRFSTLDGIRGITSLSVMVAHLTEHSGHPIFAGADLAVDLFFCLSGFVLAHAYLPKLSAGMGIGDFLMRRLIRLYPMFLAGASIGVVALLLKYLSGQTDLALPEIATAVGLNLACLPYLGDFFIGFGINGVPSAVFPVNDPTWSLFFELAVNLFLAALLLRFERVPALALSLLGALGLGIFYLLNHSLTPGWGADNFIGGFPRTMFSFFAGIVVYRLYAARSHPGRGIPPLLICLVTATALYEGYNLPHLRNLCLLAIPAFIYCAAFSVPRSAMGGRALSRLGRLSYPLYCVHFPLYSLATTLFGARFSPLVVGAATAPVAIAVATLIARHYDTPARKWLEARYRGRRPLAA